MNKNSCKTELRITKYDPQYRNELGYYLRDEWTEISDVGRTFEGKLLTANEYLETEARYVEALKILLNAYGISEMSLYRWGNWKAYSASQSFYEISNASEDLTCLVSSNQFPDYDNPERNFQIRSCRISLDDGKKAVLRYSCPDRFFTNNKYYNLSNEFIDSLQDGRVCTLEEIEILTILALRNFFGCRFAGPHNSHIHFGWNYYMFFGCDLDCNWPSLKFPEGIFVEAIQRPDFPEENEDEDD